jgi:hypothetical protein
MRLRARSGGLTVVAVVTACSALGAADEAWAQEDDGWSDELVITTGRVPAPPPDPRSTQLVLHGEDQLRVLGATDLRLDPPIRERTEEASVLGQSWRVEHWLRLRPRIDFEDVASVVGEIDVPRGMVAGQSTRFVTAARDSFDEPEPFAVHPRQLFLEVRSPIGLFRVGQQASFWGMGLLANDGNTPTWFGDYRRGDLVERLLFATRPFGKDHPFIVALAGDVVFEDDTADLLDDEDLATQGVLALAWRDRPAEIGVYGVVRHHQRDRAAVFPSPDYTEELTVFVLDVAGKFHAPVPGASGFVYGEFEAAVVLGETDFVRTSWLDELDPAAARDVREDVEQLAGAARLGFVHLSHERRGAVLANGQHVLPPGGEEPWGDVVAEIEAGWASGDADPGDGVSKRFVFDANHNVGLVLFDHVLAWKTARAATNARDPRVVGRPPPGIDLLASDGGVFGATYINPRFMVRPARWLDLKVGMVVAQATADVVDPYRFGALGSPRNWDGGDPSRRDLGLELDAGSDVRFPIGDHVTGQLGVEGGVLFPGGAFDDAAGRRLPVQALGQAKAGLQF